MKLYNTIFSNIEYLPEPLSKEETNKLIKEIQKNNEEAKKKLIEHNIRLVVSEVLHKFKNTTYDKDELVSIGIIGLIKAASTYNNEKNALFSTYAIKCIDNEILMHLRKQKTTEANVIISLDDEFTTQGNNNTDKCRYIDTIPSNIDLEEDYFKKEIISIIKETIQELPDKEKEVTKLYFGFYDRMYNQVEIASIIGLTQSYTSRIIRKTMEMIKVKLMKKDIIEYKSTTKKKTKKKLS